MEKEKKIFIECECGTHFLEVSHDVEIFDKTNSNTDKPMVRQEFWLAMFSYGTYHKKPGFFERLRVIFNYMRTGKMHSDQLILDADEAKKLVNFIVDNIIETEKE